MIEAELGGDDDLVAERRHAFAENPFDLVRTVRLGGVEERDASVERGPDDVEHLGPARDRGLVRAAHVLDAEADAGDVQRPSFRRPLAWAATGPRLAGGLRAVPPSSETAASCRHTEESRRLSRAGSLLVGFATTDG